jgi:NAD-dependent deacetylase
VEPAASIPLHACRTGADLVIINRDQTPLDEFAVAVIREPIGPTLQAIADRSLASER